MEHQTSDDSDLADKQAAFLEHQDEEPVGTDPNEIDYDTLIPMKDEDLPF
jgi:hypothetical protein